MGLWSDHFPGATVAEVTPHRQRHFIGWMRSKGNRDSYISRVLSVGRAALRWAWKEGELVSVPFVLDVHRDPDLEAERYRELNMKEVALLMGAAAKTPHLLKFCVIGLNTLARPEAILELGPDQVDLNRRLLNLNPPGRKQTKKYRPQVPITDTLLPWLIECNASRYILYRNSPIANIKGSFGKAAAEAGLQRVTPYCLRHTMATELRARSVPEWEVMEMLGHRNKATRTSERVREVPSKLPERGREGD